MGSGWFGSAVGRLTRLLAPFVGLRDGFLVVGAGLYALGYFAWALYAWANGLGLLPVLSAQYVAAGATIGLFLLSAWLIVDGLWLAQKRLHLWLDEPTEERLTARWILALVCFVAGVVFITSAILRRFLPELLPVILMLPYGILVFFSEEVEEPPRWLRVAYVRLMRPFGRAKLRPLARSVLRPQTYKKDRFFYGLILSVALAVAFVILGGFAFYYLPRELGGPSPSCVELDLDGTMLSGEARRDLLPDPAHEGKIVRTVPLDLMFAGGDSLLVRRRATQPGAAHPVYAIASRLVGATVDCE